MSDAGEADLREADEVVRVIDIRAAGGAAYLLMTVYPEGEPLAAAGRVRRVSVDRDGEAELMLGAGHTLTCLWTSAAGHVWAASANGRVWTTAPVAFAAGPLEAALDVQADPAVAWRQASLPVPPALGYGPNLSCLFGFGDDDVFAGTFEGFLYHFDGRTWSILASDRRAGGVRMHGLRRDDLYAACDGGVVLHFDGQRWRSAALPAEGGHGTVTAVRVLPDGRVDACDTAGRVYRGSAAAGFAAIAHTPGRPWYGMAVHDGRIVLASRDGAFQLDDADQVVPMRTTFGALDVTEVGRGLFFVADDQDQAPAVIDFDPGVRGRPWIKRSY